MLSGSTPQKPSIYELKLNVIFYTEKYNNIQNKLNDHTFNNLW